MKQRLSILFFLFIGAANAQQYSVQWVLGDAESVLDFRNDALTNYSIQPLMPMFLTSANICDSIGNLLFYTNGIYIADSTGNQMDNGDSLNPCDYTNQNACCGLNIYQAALFLPKPESSKQFFLIHFSNDTLDGGRPGTMYYSLIDQSLNNGLGKVIQKNVPFFTGQVLRGGGMTACKHGNGRDYWIVVGSHFTNEYYEFLLTPDTILGPFTQAIGPSYDGSFDLAYSKFSMDGSKYVTSCATGPILVMDFDRCSGQFSNPVIMYNQYDGAIVEFSPNGRFVYATNAVNLTQYDLTLPNPQHDSLILYQADSNDVAEMGMLQIAPNGKLYATCYQGGFHFIHAVNYPDLKGDSAEYVDTAFTTLTANTVQFPNMINYNLGPLVGSVCDSIKAPNAVQPITGNILRIMPNPADKYIYVALGSQSNYEFELLNDMGQIVATRETRQVDIFDTENLASGIYFLRVVDKNDMNKITTTKIVVQH